MSFIRGYYRLSLSLLLLVFFAVLVVITSYLPFTIKNVPLSLRMAQGMVRSILWVLNVRVICDEKEKMVGFNGFFFPNHLSYVEVLALYSIMPSRYLVKAEIRDWPAIGAIAAGIGCVFVQRGDKQSRKEARHALAQLDTFPPITIFPEGTRGPGDKLLPFRHGAFEIVTQGGFTYLPVAAKFSNVELAIWRHHENLFSAAWRLAKQPEQVEVHVQPLTPYHTSPEDDPVELAEKVHGELTAVLFPHLKQDNN